jgi:hypothetical protein
MVLANEPIQDRLLVTSMIVPTYSRIVFSCLASEDDILPLNRRLFMKYIVCVFGAVYRRTICFFFNYLLVNIMVNQSSRTRGDWSAISSFLFEEL